MAATQLAPAPRPIGIFQKKVFSFSGDSFEVKKADGGPPLFQIKGEAFSLSGRKHLLNSDGAPLFDLRKGHFTLHKTFHGEDEAGNRLLEVRKKFQPVVGSKAIRSLVSVTGAEEELIMEGDFFDSRAEISTKEGLVVALVDRKYFNAREFVGGQQTYGVTVAPNVDMSIITAMRVCLDELRNEGQ
ncbi:DUF567-domain-containing protein [Macrophomina phaseolina]|uniref:DUF567-domain-containing protein n=1 Tax=Macrophomina phaseolina TaxID=35725 RepID=A0ABQ8FS55_9PEZI|nr:DUF567-domain-containing protein [Macrophomina phaseolina]